MRQVLSKEMLTALISLTIFFAISSLIITIINIGKESKFKWILLSMICFTVFASLIFVELEFRNG